MTKLDFSIGTIKHSIECTEDELSAFKEIVSTLNTKTNEIMMDTGKISDRLILFIILLINANKEQKIFNNFEEKILKLLKSVSNLLNSGDNLDSQLILSNIIKQNQTANLKEENIIEENKKNNSQTTNQNIEKELLENKKNNDETLLFVDEIIKFIQKLANNIDKL